VNKKQGRSFELSWVLLIMGGKAPARRKEVPANITIREDGIAKGKLHVPEELS